MIFQNIQKNNVFNLREPLDTIPLSKIEIESIFLPTTEKATLTILQKYQVLDLII